MQYLAVMDLHGRSDPINLGAVSVDEYGFVNGETPIEDYGMFMLRDKPFPDNKEKLTRMFLRLLRQRDQ
jgi:hypothetical protein